jgi:hypothetical protein
MLDARRKIHTLDDLCPVYGSRHAHHRQTGQNPHDGDNNQKLNERKGSVNFRLSVIR